MIKKTLDYKYVTDLSDYKKIDVVLKNRPVFDEHYIFVYLSQTRWSVEHTQTMILLRFKYFNICLKCNTFTRW